MKVLHSLRFGAIAAALLGGALPASADYVVKQGDAGGTQMTLCGKTSNGVQIPCHVLVDASNAAVGTLTNPFHIGLTIGGVDLAYGQKVSAGSVPVALSTEQEAILTALKTAFGTCAETPYTGTGTATFCSVLKGVYSQAAASGLLGATPAVGANIAYVQVPIGAPALDTVVKGSSSDVGGTITFGGAAQTFMAANSARRGWTLQNQSTADLYVNCSSTATADWHSLRIASGAYYATDPQHVGTGACSIIGAATGQAFFARQF